MLAATRARPSATRYSPTPTGDGSWLRSPWRAAALSATRRARRRATAGAGGSPARSAASCPHAAPTSWPRFRRIVVSMPAARKRRREALDDRHRAGAPGRVRDRVHRDEVDVGVVAAQQLDHRRRVGLGVVDAADHRDLVADPPAGRARHGRVLRRRPRRPASAGSTARARRAADRARRGARPPA